MMLRIMSGTFKQTLQENTTKYSKLLAESVQLVAYIELYLVTMVTEL